MPQVTDKHWC